MHVVSAATTLRLHVQHSQGTSASRCLSKILTPCDGVSPKRYEPQSSAVSTTTSDKLYLSIIQVIVDAELDRISLFTLTHVHAMQTTGTKSTPPDGCLAHLTRVIKSFLWKTWLQRGDRTTRPLEWSETSLPPSPINHLGITPTLHPSPNLRALLHLSRGQQTHPSPAERHMSAARTSRLLPRSSFPAPRFTPCCQRSYQLLRSETRNTCYAVFDLFA